jgi:hypothetical protein
MRVTRLSVMASAGYYGIQQIDPLSLPVWLRDYTWLAMMLTISLGVFLVCIDILAPRRKLVILSGTFLGLLVGLLMAYALSFVVKLLVEQFASAGTNVEQLDRLIQFINLVIVFIVVAFVVFLISRILIKPAPAGPEMKTCPFCKEPNAEDATKCKACASTI